MRIAVAATAVCLSVVGMAVASDVEAAMRKSTHIPAQRLDHALQILARERGLAMAYRSELVGTVQTAGASGDLTRDEALTQLLSGTGLTYLYLDDKTVTIVPTPANPVTRSSNEENDGAAKATQDSGSKGAPNDKEQRAERSFWDRFRLAQVDQGTTSPSSAVSGTQIAASAEGKPASLEEIVVTAQKRTERLLEVPVPVSVINTAQLTDSNQLRLQDYYTSVPGLSFGSKVLSQQILSIRGITTGGTSNPTVGIMVDDVPYGASTALGGGQVVPDFDPGDLARVEVLRGPQGTLYGASSLGGLLKFVTIDPSTEAFSGRVQAGTSSVYNGAEPGYNFRGSVNIPLSDELAVRASAFTRQDPGYIDNPVLHVDGINEDRASGGRLAALWRPSDTLSLKLSALYQDIRGDGSSDVDKPINGYVGPALGDLQQNYVPGIGAYDRSVQAYSATLMAKMGGIELTSISGYNVNRLTDSFDYSYLLGSSTLKQFGVRGTPTVNHGDTDKFSQEVRLSGSLWQRLDWLVGAFYTNERSHEDEEILAENPTGSVVGQWLYLLYPDKYEETAEFADLTYHFTDRFDVQFGARESDIRQTFNESYTGPYVPVFLKTTSPDVLQTQHSSGTPFTYLVTPRYRVSNDFMVYARLASGYRAGGSNTLGPGIPAQYSPDKTKNYELGVKTDVLDHKLTLDTSLYYIDWSDIQLHALNLTTGGGYITNGSGAKSQGVELSFESVPLTGFSISGWVVWDDAELTKGFPPGPSYGMTGNPLPYTSRFSSNLSLQQDFPLWGRTTGFVGGAVSYVGDRKGDFTASAVRQDYPAYAKVDLRGGVNIGSWTVNIFANNVANRLAVIGGGLGQIPPFGFTYLQPRTVGMSLAKSF